MNFQNRIEAMRRENRGWIDYAITFYRYQDSIGYNHRYMLRLEEPSRMILEPNNVMES